MFWKEEFWRNTSQESLGQVLVFLCSTQRKNMEIFLLPPFGLGGKFGFSLCAQTRTEKLLRGGKIGRGGIRSIDFGVKPFKKGLAGFKRTASFACTLRRYSLFFTASKTFPSALFRKAKPKILSETKRRVPDIAA